MLLFGQAKITVDAHGRVRVYGALERYAARIAGFFEELGPTRVTVVLRGGRYRVRGLDDARLEQRIRNFLINECPLKRSEM